MLIVTRRKFDQCLQYRKSHPSYILGDATGCAKPKRKLGKRQLKSVYFVWDSSRGRIYYCQHETNVDKAITKIQ